jgi:hypothetical protein
VRLTHRYLTLRPDAKGKSAVSSNSKLIGSTDWNGSKNVCGQWYTAASLVVSMAGRGTLAPANAQRGVGAAIAGGLIGGAIVGGALAGPGYYYGPGYYGPGYGYYGGPAYVAGPGYGGPCYWQRQRFWDGYGWRFRRVRVCG